MPRLPQPGSDNGTWGDVLNDYLSQTHKPDGTLKDNVVTSSTLAPNAVTAAAVQDGSITEAQLHGDVQAKLNATVNHTYTIADIDNLQSTLDTKATTAALASGLAGKQDAGDYATNTALTSGLAGKANTTHNHAASDITSGVLATARLGSGTASVSTYLRGDQSWQPLPNPPIVFSAATAVIGVTASDRAYYARTLTGARMRVASAPSGSALTVQVQHSTDGASWSNVGSAFSIASDSTTEASVSFTQAQSVGHLVRLNVTSVGATTAATGVVVDVLWS